MDLYHTVERGGHIAACCINCRIKDTKVLGTCMGHVKRHFYVGTHSECAYPPTSYLLPKPHSLKWQREWSFGGLIWEGEAQRRNITRQVRLVEKVGTASHQPQPSTLIRALKLKSRKRLTQGAQGANTPRRTVVKLLRPEDWRPSKEERKFPGKVSITSTFNALHQFS